MLLMPLASFASARSVKVVSVVPEVRLAVIVIVGLVVSGSRAGLFTDTRIELDLSVLGGDAPSVATAVIMCVPTPNVRVILSPVPIHAAPLYHAMLPMPLASDAEAANTKLVSGVPEVRLAVIIMVGLVVSGGGELETPIVIEFDLFEFL